MSWESSPVSPGDTATADQYNKARNDAIAARFEDFTYGEAIAVNDALYLKASDGKAYKTDADFDDERIHSFIGFAAEVGNANDVKKVQIAGKVSGLSGLTAAGRYYLSGTAGAISAIPGAYKKCIGIAVSSAKLMIEKYSEFANLNAPTRVANTEYQNGNKWRLIMAAGSASGQFAGGYSGSLSAAIGSSSPASTYVGGLSASASGNLSGSISVGGMIIFIVPPRWYYKITQSAQGAGIGTWYEVDLNW